MLLTYSTFYIHVYQRSQTRPFTVKRLAANQIEDDVVSSDETPYTSYIFDNADNQLSDSMGPDIGPEPRQMIVQSPNGQNNKLHCHSQFVVLAK